MGVAASPEEERTAKAEQKGVEPREEGKTEKANLFSELAIYAPLTTLIVDFGLFDSRISSSFSLDTGKCSFPS